MKTLIFEKTQKGHDEISQRKLHLASRVRTLLLLTDGRQTVGQLLQKTAALEVHGQGGLPAVQAASASHYEPPQPPHELGQTEEQG